MNKETCNMLAVKVLLNVLMFWENIHTINSSYTSGKWNAECVWGGAHFHLLKIWGITFVI